MRLPFAEHLTHEALRAAIQAMSKEQSNRDTLNLRNSIVSSVRYSELNLEGVQFVLYNNAPPNKQKIFTNTNEMVGSNCNITLETHPWVVFMGQLPNSLPHNALFHLINTLAGGTEGNQDNVIGVIRANNRCWARVYLKDKATYDALILKTGCVMADLMGVWVAKEKQIITQAIQTYASTELQTALPNDDVENSLRRALPTGPISAEPAQSKSPILPVRQTNNRNAQPVADHRIIQTGFFSPPPSYQQHLAANIQATPPYQQQHQVITTVLHVDSSPVS